MIFMGLALVHFQKYWLLSNYIHANIKFSFFLTAHQSNRVCNALALLQCVASHPETRSAFLLAHIPLYLYPFLHTVSKTRPFEYLRLTSLGVIGKFICYLLKEFLLLFDIYWNYSLFLSSYWSVLIANDILPTCVDCKKNQHFCFRQRSQTTNIRRGSFNDYVR